MKTVFQDLQNILQVDILSFLERYQSFVQTNLQSIFNYYKDTTKSVPAKSFEALNSLISDGKIILEKYSINSYRISNCEQLEFMDLFENCFFKLETYSQLGKWVKSDRFIENVSNEYILSEKETIEQTASKIGYNNRDEGFIDLTLQKNRIRELDYSLDGGLSFFYAIVNRGNKLKLNSLIDDNIQGERVYGIDLDATFKFINDDIAILTPKETFYQTCFILLNLKLNDNPEFPNDGIDKTLLSNKIVTSTGFPMILRQLTNVITKDDTIKAFELKDVQYVSDAIFIELNFYSHLNDVIEVRNEN